MENAETNNAVARNIDANNSLDSVAKLCHNQIVARLGDVLVRVRGALQVDATRLRELSTEMEKYADAHNRYLALERETAEHEKSAHALIALLGPKAFLNVMKHDESGVVGDEIDIYPSAADLRDRTPLWEHVRTYLRFVSEVQVNDVVMFLKWLGITCSRQAVESAVKAHKETFAVKQRGRERFISLKKGA